MLDLVNPVGAGRRLVGGGWKAGFDEACPVSRRAAYAYARSTCWFIQVAAAKSSNRNNLPARRVERVAHRQPSWRTEMPTATPRNPTKSAMGTGAAMADLCVVARTSACRVAGGLVALEDAGAADAQREEEQEGPVGIPPVPQRPAGLAKCAPRGATKSALEGQFSFLRFHAAPERCGSAFRRRVCRLTGKPC